MSELRLPIRASLFCAALALLLAGCNESELRTRVATVESRLSAPLEKPNGPVPVPLPFNATPIRHAIVPNEMPEKSAERMLLQKSLLAPPPFYARHDKNGQLVLSGVGSFGEQGEKWLQSAGFAKQKNGAWEKRMSPTDLPELEGKTFEALGETTKALEKSMQDLTYVEAGGVFFIKDNFPQAGSVVYTGNMLDFAFDENNRTPEFFIDFGLPQVTSSRPGDPEKPHALPHTFSRGGRMIVNNGDLYFQSNSIHKLLETKVPTNASHLALSTEGVVTAYDPSGKVTELGRIPYSRVKKFKDGAIEETASIDDYIKEHGKGPFRPGYLEFPQSTPVYQLAQIVEWRNTLLALQAGINAAPKPSEAPAESDVLPLIVHMPLPKTTEHLTALKIAAEKTNERTTIGTGTDETDVANALVTVLQGLRRRMTVHEENLRNAGKTRDSEGRLNAYRRKTVSIGPQGNLIEGVDKSELPKNYKPGDPDAGPDGFVVLSNVNKAVESAEFKATIEEYKLLRTALERLAPKHVFPDPPAAP